MNKKMTATMLALGMALGMSLTACLAASTEPTGELPPCATEDSTNCVWDAETQGNGQGTSFIDIDGTTYPLEDEQTVEDEVQTLEEVTEEVTGAKEPNREPKAKVKKAEAKKDRWAPRPKDEDRATGPVKDHDENVLFCGVGAKPAMDQDPYGNWWAYCEPALVD